MTTITTTRGRNVEIEINGFNVVARSGNVEFIADRTDTGFKTRFPLNGQQIEVALEGENLNVARAMFAELDEMVRVHVEREDAYDRHVQKINTAMRSL